MTSRGIKFSSNNDEEENSRLLDYDAYEDEFEVTFWRFLFTYFTCKLLKVTKYWSISNWKGSLKIGRKSSNFYWFDPFQNHF